MERNCFESDVFVSVRVLVSHQNESCLCLVGVVTVALGRKPWFVSKIFGLTMEWKYIA